MYPFSTAAAKLLPSDEDVTDIQFRIPPAVWSVHVTPPSPLVEMYPLATTAANLIPSDEDVIDLH
jgi:hypothetical protein